MENRRQQTVAQSWLVCRLTDSPALLGLVGFSSQIPVFLPTPLGFSTAGGMTTYPQDSSTLRR